jgi:START domain
MFRNKILLALLIFVIDGDNWILKKNQENIMVYTRRITTSDYKELRCSTTVKSSLSAIVKLLGDADHYTDWVYKCVEAMIVKKPDETEVYSYQLFDAPWPLDDRDVVAHLKVRQDKNTKIVTILSNVVDSMVAEKRDVVRIKKFHSSYTLTPKGNGFVSIDYELGTEPGGSVPAWLANLVMVNGPFSTQQMMNALLQTERYKTVKLQFIDEP